MTASTEADETRPLLAAADGPTAAAASSSPSLSPSATPRPGAATPASFDDDPDNPRNWPAAFKWAIVLLLALLAFTVTFTCISVVPVASHIVDELEGHNGTAGGGGRSDGRVHAASVLLVTIWELGEAAGPLAIAPLSETAAWGRAAVLSGATLLFALACAAAALAPSTALFIAARGLTGVAVATNVLSPAIVGDLFPPDQRGSAMALVQLTPLMGGAIGPAIGGAVADTWGWRSVVWLSTGLAVLGAVLVWAAFRETYAPAILHARRRRLQQQAGAAAKALAPATAATPPEEADVGVLSAAAPAIAETLPASSGLRHMRDAVLRPALLLANSFVLAAIALYGAVLFAYFYIMSVSLPGILESRYGFSSAATGSSFLIFSLGALVSVVVCDRYLDRIYRHLTRTRGRLRPDGTRVGRPEFKLPLTMACAVLMPVAVAAYGWSAELTLPLPCLLLAEALMGASMMLTLIPVAAYVVDSFGLYAASAMTGVIVTRCLCGTFLPLAVAPLVDAFGYGWGFTALAVVCLAAVPIPAVLFVYGEAWRQLSTYTRDA